ncbi:hypothetical protein GO013_02005 [Pseudodesulfovibrio sp. JC047]|uniref:hypothetical protein n=1 Tax=Pseudodesulfovibrio sp. JC047 TaxID=2683199 RepID=UPI0013D13294|nr:hypothetical protein [Pseudodesulfovibrio sp. JC047]NDV18191.1 hypothetical protein [Pseudodesulfovibrio sp. JC047]
MYKWFQLFVMAFFMVTRAECSIVDGYETDISLEILSLGIKFIPAFLALTGVKLWMRIAAVSWTIFGFSKIVWGIYLLTQRTPPNSYDIFLGFIICCLAYTLFVQEGSKQTDLPLWKVILCSLASAGFWIPVLRMTEPAAHIAALYTIIAMECLFMTIPYIYIARGGKRWPLGAIFMAFAAVGFSWGAVQHVMDKNFHSFGLWFTAPYSVLLLWLSWGMWKKQRGRNGLV